MRCRNPFGLTKRELTARLYYCVSRVFSGGEDDPAVLAAVREVVNALYGFRHELAGRKDAYGVVELFAVALALRLVVPGLVDYRAAGVVEALADGVALAVYRCFCTG